MATSSEKYGSDFYDCAMQIGFVYVRFYNADKNGFIEFVRKSSSPAYICQTIYSYLVKNELIIPIDRLKESDKVELFDNVKYLPIKLTDKIKKCKAIHTIRQLSLLTAPQ